MIKRDPGCHEFCLNPIIDDSRPKMIDYPNETESSLEVGYLGPQIEDSNVSLAISLNPLTQFPVAKSVNQSHDLEYEKKEGPESDQTNDTKFQTNTGTMSSYLILNSMIGSGIFNQPYVFSKSGVGYGVILTSVTALFVWLGMVALIEAGVHTSTYDFSSLGYICFGRPGANAVNLSIIVIGIGSIMSYMAVIGHLSTILLASWGWNFAIHGGIYLVTSLLIIVFVFPFCAYRSFGHFAFISVLSMASVCSITILILIAGPIISENNVKATEYFISDGALSQLGSIIFALNCSPSVFATYTSMKKEEQNVSGWRRVAFSSVLRGYSVIIVMGISGYLVFGDKTEEMIITNFTHHYADIFKILLIAHLVLYTPLDFVILRQSMLKIAGVSSGHVVSWSIHLLVTAVILGGASPSLSLPANKFIYNDGLPIKLSIRLTTQIRFLSFDILLSNH